MDDDSPSTPESIAADAEPASWKDALRRDFEAWLSSVDQIPPGADREIEEPDLCSFFEQLAGANAEARKSNRRTAEAFSQWGDTLERLHEDLRFFRDQLGRIEPPQAEANSLPRPYCLALVEFLDRLRRMAEAYASPPGSRWWRSRDEKWKRQWDMQRQA